MANAPWILTYSGRQMYPLEPTPEMISIEDVAHALSLQCRFTGHVRAHYSVADHCIHVAELLPPELKLWGLLHDAAEAYLTDVARPIKPYLLNYDAIEDRLMTVVAAKFGLSLPMPAAVKHADVVMLAVERRDLMPNAGPAWAELPPIPECWAGRTLEPRDPETAKRTFLGLLPVFLDWNRKAA